MTFGSIGRPGSAGWFTSSYSNELNACVQVRFIGAEVDIADSKNRGRGPVITVSGTEWTSFLVSVLDGRV